MSAIPERHARRIAVRGLALALMDRHGLRGWAFGFNRRKRTLGLCLHTEQRIELSIYFVDGNGEEEVRDTILHEIAHALVGPEHAHDYVWKAKAVEVGARPMRCGEAEMPEGRWKASCTGCGMRYSRHRRPKRMHGWFCRGCGPVRGSLTWRVSGGETGNPVG